MQNLTIKGKVWKFGDEIDTDLIIPGKYLAQKDPLEWAAHAFEPISSGFAQKVKKDDIIVAGNNFGCGSAREHATIAIKKMGIGAVLAESIARIFFRNAINNGLLVIECRGISVNVNEGDILEIDLSSSKILHSNRKRTYDFIKVPEIILEIISAGGLIPYLKQGHHGFQ